MKTFKEYLSETKITSRDDRYFVWNKEGKLLGNYDSQEAAERHTIGKKVGTRADKTKPKE